MRIALITGASSGLGKEFAYRIDIEEANIDEIWLLARRKEKLEVLGQQLKHKARVFAMDMCAEENIDNLKKAMEAEGVEVGLLVNCAGYAKIGNYDLISRYDSLHMIDLNCRAAVDITIACLPFMKTGDRIIELCSTAAFQPFQHLNIYAASKAFLYSYSRALRTELIPRGIKVTAACPYWIKDTEFIGIAKDTSSEEKTEKKAASAIKSFFGASKAKTVAGWVLRDSRADFAVSTPGPICFIHRVFSKIIPKSGLMYIWEILRRM